MDLSDTRKLTLGSWLRTSLITSVSSRYGYLSYAEAQMTLTDFPAQANSNGAGGTYPLQAEISSTYIAKVIRKVQREGYQAIYPSQEATDDFNEIITAYFDDKVIGDDCDGWWKSGFGKSRPLVMWPGTGHHRFDIVRDPRWEDFVFERSDEGRRNRFEYFGNGWTEREKNGDEISLTKYFEEGWDCRFGNAA